MSPWSSVTACASACAAATGAAARSSPARPARPRRCRSRRPWAPDVDIALRRYCQQRKAAMLAERDLFLADWQQVADYVDPPAGRYLNRKPGPLKLPSRAKVLNSRVKRGVKTMNAGFMGGHTSKSRPWFLV